MEITGIQKLTLVDYPGKMACTLFAHGCNLRCPFCHNPALVLDAADGGVTAEALAYLEKRRGILQGVVITGGEPLLQRGIDGLMQTVKSMGYPVKLDTNGCFPDKLLPLIQRGLIDYVALDIKNSPQSYGKTVGLPSFDITPVLETMEILKNTGVEYEYRTTLVRELHSQTDIESMAMWLADAPKYFLQAFVPSQVINDSLHIFDTLSAFSRDEMLAAYETVRKHVPSVKLRGI